MANLTARRSARRLLGAYCRGVQPCGLMQRCPLVAKLRTFSRPTMQWLTRWFLRSYALPSLASRTPPRSAKSQAGNGCGTRATVEAESHAPQLLLKLNLTGAC